MGQRGDQDQQGAGGDGRGHQRNRDLTDNRTLCSAGDTGGFFQGGIHTLQGGYHLHKNEGEVVRNFYENDAPQGVDVQGGSFQAKGVHQPGVNVAAASGQQHVPGHGPEEWGEHVRDHKQGPHEAFAGNVAAAQQPGVEQADDGAEDGYGKADDDGIGHGIHVIFAEYYCLEHFDVELSFKEEGVVDDHKDWNKYDDEQQHKADHGHGFIQPESGAVKSR